MYDISPSGKYYVNLEIKNWFEVMWTLDRISNRQVIYSLINSGFTTPVYGYYYEDSITHRMTVSYTDDVNKAKNFIYYTEIPAIYALEELKDTTGYHKHEYKVKFKLSIKDIVDNFLSMPVSYIKKEKQPIHHKSHTAWTNSGINYKRLLTFYSKSNSEAYKMRHNSRYTRWRKKYSQVLDWDGVAHCNSSGWKSHKYRHQWQHNL